LLDDASIKCWGFNNGGQLGLGDTADRGDQPGEMGDALAAVSLGTAHTALAVATGNYHTCALLDDGLVKCWGHNNYEYTGAGQLGLGDTATRGDQPGELGDNLPVVDL
jgi:alpha-tubulin suppressor-like RCC1 family protein